jgi:hypothetical protein
MHYTFTEENALPKMTALEFLEEFTKLPTIAQIIKAPKVCALPAGPSGQVCLLHMLAYFPHDDDSAKAVLKYVARMPAEMQAYFVCEIGWTRSIGVFAACRGGGKLLKDSMKLIKANHAKQLTDNQGE